MERVFTLKLGILVCLGSIASAATTSAFARAVFDPAFGAKDSRTLTVNGTQLTYVVRGEGEPIVLVHGSASDFRIWQSFLPEASGKYRVFAYSRRYFYPNPSSRTLPRFEGPTDVKDLIAFIEALRVGPVHLVGHSSGGQASLSAAVERPELIRSLVLAEGGFLETPGASNPGVTASRKGRELMEAGKDDEAVRTFVDAVTGPGSYDALPPDERQRIRDNRMALGLPMSASPSCKQVGALPMPLLLIGGDKSPPFLKDFVKALHDCHPSAKRVTIPNASHAMHLDNPEAFNAAVLQFIGGKR